MSASSCNGIELFAKVDPCRDLELDKDNKWVFFWLKEPSQSLPPVNDIL